MSSTKRNIFVLIDCNNFFVSCERIFNPRLNKRPVVVLSNNDGCVISRSIEAKALGIPMGAPAFMHKDLFKVHNVAVCSSNFPLYGDISRRIMSVLGSFSSQMQVYSIDEAFLLLNEEGLEERCQEIRKMIYQWVGVPVTVGASTTKTLAKLAASIGKKSAEGYFLLTDEKQRARILEDTNVGEVWGIGRRMEALLRAKGILSIQDFIALPDQTIRKWLTVNGLRIAEELRGKPCFTLLENAPLHKSRTFSRSFRVPILTLETMSEVVSGFTARLAEKIREENLAAYCLQVTVMSSLHDPLGYYNKASIRFSQPTAYTPRLISAAKEALVTIFKEGHSYKKAGVELVDLVPENTYQHDFFAAANQEKEESLMQVVDHLNERFGNNALKFGAEGVSFQKSSSSMLSKAFTSRWDELLTIAL